MIKQMEITYYNEQFKLITIREFIDDVIIQPDEVIDFLNEHFKLSQCDAESFYIFGFEQNGLYCTSFYQISKGNWQHAPSYQREMILYMLLSHNYDFYLYHNHPSGDPEPSKDDQDILLQTSLLADMFDLKISNSFIISNTSYYNIKSKRTVSYGEYLKGD